MTGLRFPAALAIVIYHYGKVVGGFDSLPASIRGAVACGPVAVSLFFMLSGFLLGSRHPHVGDKKAFWISRFARLYPAYLFAFFLFIPIAYTKYIASAHEPKLFFASAILNLSMLQSWTPLAQSWNGPSWSLSVEAFFYFVFPFVINKISGLGLRWFAVAGVMISTLIGVAFGLGFISEPVWRSQLENNPILWLPLFILGIAMARTLPSWRAMVGAGLNDFLLILATLCLFTIPFVLPAAYRTGYIGGGAAVILILIIMGHAHHQGWLQSLLGGKLLLRLGSASYILYIIQAPTWHLFHAASNVVLGQPAMGGTVTIPQFLLFLAILVSMSLLLEQYLEKPLNKWIRRQGKASVRTGTTMVQSMQIVPPVVSVPSAKRFATFPKDSEQPLQSRNLR